MQDLPAGEVVVLPSPAKVHVGVAVDLVELLSPHRRHPAQNAGVWQAVQSIIIIVVVVVVVVVVIIIIVIIVVVVVIIKLSTALFY